MSLHAAPLRIMAPNAYLYAIVIYRYRSFLKRKK